MVGPPWLFFDLPSIVFVVGWAVATGVMTHGWAGLGAGMRGLGVLFVGPGPAGFPGPAVLRSLRRGLYAGGGLGVVIGVVQMLANLADPAAIGPGLGAALFSLFTALVLAELLCRPALERLEAMDAVAGGPTLGSNPGPD
jgi:hypothetical protein